MSRLKKSSRTDDDHIPGNQEGALKYPLNFPDSLIFSQETGADTKKIIGINIKEIIVVNQEIGERNHAEQNPKKIVKKGPIGSDHKAHFEAFNHQQILKIINNLKSDLKSTEYYWCWIDEFVPGHKFLETISQVKSGLEEMRNRN
ncbi:18036_t:CDS:2 [Cetraspora pellucida]|uniref:18036_t:CDS:1 n=1 Tax=Cetraspora pellucida TaxID=1433469 RepID=A0ACA9P6Q8_9GLOM|nr:18036_t:CDS:2 [Cetraspora pellucida]